MRKDPPNIIEHPTSHNAKQDKAKARDNLARQLRTNQMMRESARERINASQIIDDIHEIELGMRGFATEAVKEVKDPTTGEISTVRYEMPIPLDKDVLMAFRARADLKFRLLNKVLPDLKATESISHNVHDHNVVHSPVSSVELATRIHLWQGQIAEINPVLEHKRPATAAEEDEVIGRIRRRMDKRAAESVVEDTLPAEPEYDWL